MFGAVMLHHEHRGAQLERNVLSTSVFSILQKFVDEMSVIGVEVLQQSTNAGVFLQRNGERLAILVELLDEPHTSIPWLPRAPRKRQATLGYQLTLSHDEARRSAVHSQPGPRRLPQLSLGVSVRSRRPLSCRP